MKLYECPALASAVHGQQHRQLFLHQPHRRSSCERLELVGSCGQRKAFNAEEKDNLTDKKLSLCVPLTVPFARAASGTRKEALGPARAAIQSGQTDRNPQTVAPFRPLNRSRPP